MTIKFVTFVAEGFQCCQNDPLLGRVNNFDDSITAASTFGFNQSLNCSVKKGSQVLDTRCRNYCQLSPYVPIHLHFPVLLTSLVSSCSRNSIQFPGNFLVISSRGLLVICHFTAIWYRVFPVPLHSFEFIFIVSFRKDVTFLNLIRN